MTSRRERARTAVRAAFEEAKLFFGYAFIVFVPGSNPPRHPHASPDAPKLPPANWTDEECQLYIDEARLDVQHQQTEKRDIRARAQVMLTTAIVVAGAIVASYVGKAGLCVVESLLYIAAGLFTTMAGLAAGGIISAKSTVGTVSLTALPHYESGELRRTVANGYASTRNDGAETVATLVTVLRVCVLAIVLGAGFLAAAHITA